MSFSIFQTVRSYLPHEVARGAYRFLNATRFGEFERLHNTPPSETVPASFTPLHETRSIFVHVPKAAGTSVGYNLFGCKTGDHMSLLDYRTAFPRDLFDDAFKFTFVRNPWDRLVSAYFYLKDGNRSTFDQAQAARSVLPYDGFTEFVTGFVNRKNVNDLIHFREQHLFLRLPGRGIGVNFIGRYENLHENFNEIARRLGKNVTLQHRNASALRKADYRALYTPETIDIVAQTYARDIAYFGYTFENE